MPQNFNLFIPIYELVSKILSAPPRLTFGKLLRGDAEDDQKSYNCSICGQRPLGTFLDPVTSKANRL